MADGGVKHIQLYLPPPRGHGGHMDTPDESSERPAPRGLLTHSLISLLLPQERHKKNWKHCTSTAPPARLIILPFINSLLGATPARLVILSIYYYISKPFLGGIGITQTQTRYKCHVPPEHTPPRLPRSCPSSLPRSGI